MDKVIEFLFQYVKATHKGSKGVCTYSATGTAFNIDRWIMYTDRDPDLQGKLLNHTNSLVSYYNNTIILKLNHFTKPQDRNEPQVFTVFKRDRVIGGQHHCTYVVAMTTNNKRLNNMCTPPCDKQFFFTDVNELYNIDDSTLKNLLEIINIVDPKSPFNLQQSNISKIHKYFKSL